MQACKAISAQFCGGGTTNLETGLFSEVMASGHQARTFSDGSRALVGRDTETCCSDSAKGSFFLICGQWSWLWIRNLGDQGKQAAHISRRRRERIAVTKCYPQATGYCHIKRSFGMVLNTSCTCLPV